MLAKKIKKAVPIKPKSKAEDLLSFIRKDKEEPKPIERKNANTKNKPSQKGIFRQWKRKDLEEWGAWDWIGYYLTKYKEIVGKEDVDFKGRPVSYKFQKEAAYLKRCKERFFEDEEEFKEFIDFIIPWWLSKDSFVEGSPSFWSIFTSSKSTFYKKFETRLVDQKPKSRQELDNHFASNDAWVEYFKED